MSTTVFPFRFTQVNVGDYDEHLLDLDDFTRSRGGRAAAIARASRPLFRAVGAVRLPQKRGPTTLNPSDLWTFREDTGSGRTGTWLYLAEHAAHREVVKGALGTGDGATKVFAFSDGTDLHKYIASADFTYGITSDTDVETVAVYVNGVLQAASGYTVTSNGTDPTVTFTVAPTNTHAITVSYLYYRFVRFSEPSFPTRTLRRRDGDDLATAQEVTEFRVTIEEDRPGGSYA